MKRLILFTLLLGLPIISMHAYYEVNKNMTVTIGETIVLDPVSDSNLSRGSNGISQYESSNSHNGEYTISDPSAFSITLIRMSYQYYGTHYYNTYQITPLVEGTYTFSQYLYDSSRGEGATVRYSITVVAVKSITIPSSLSLQLGETYTFTPTIIDNRATTLLTWISSVPEIAQIEEDGKLTAVGIGTCTITCMNSNGVSAQCVVTVTPILVDGITLNESEAELTVGEKLQLDATIAPDNATDKSVTWSSTNEAVAVVSESGLVTAVGSGICNITATANDGSGITSSCLITVLGNVMFCEDFGAVPGATVTLPIQLTNADAIQSFQFKLVLPVGVSIQTDGEGKLIATLTDRASSQDLRVANQGNGIYQFVYTGDSRIYRNNGVIVNVPIVVANNMAVGQYNVIVKDVELVKQNSSMIHHNDRIATLTINEMSPGDVNGDGKVSVADANAIINYVFGRENVSFIEIAADVNGDGNISLADVVATVDIILAGDGGNARAAAMPTILDPQ